MKLLNESTRYILENIQPKFEISYCDKAIMIATYMCPECSGTCSGGCEGECAAGCLDSCTGSAD